ncbi:MAG: histidinol-phosphate transaminase [Hydrogenophilus sp.]|nr:histidinol-phosphate transaminase [Hydrogenophilus sp.]
MVAAVRFIPEWVLSLSPYQPGKPIEELARERGFRPDEIVKLASNENALGMSPRAMAAVGAMLREGARYPDGSGYALKKALAQRLGVEPEWIVLGNGSNEVIELIARLFLRPGTSAVFSQYAFAVYPIVTQALGARAIVVPARCFGHDLTAMAEAVEQDTRVVFVANPNNPTGTFVSRVEFQTFLTRVPEEVVVLLDEAYFEYIPPEERLPSVEWVKRYPNLVVTRTFSKAYGLAALRVGYAVLHPVLASAYDRLREPFNVNGFALAAAEAALDDHRFVAESVHFTRIERERLVKAFETLGLESLPSYGNFVTVRVGEAARIYEGLLDRGVIVRPLAPYGMEEWLRVTVGVFEENERFLTALRSVLG